jgi:hypothetical protein
LSRTCRPRCTMEWLARPEMSTTAPTPQASCSRPNSWRPERRVSCLIEGYQFLSTCLLQSEMKLRIENSELRELPGPLYPVVARGGSQPSILNSRSL